ncbi:MAG: hypothetical protein EXQ90_03910 [Rhodospirillales bacterium]|nr:hypothetical protein [Rhodospirillales bacterium]
MATIMIHTLEHARAALAAAEALDRPVTVISAPGAGAYLGAGVFQAIVTAARQDHPKARATFVLDCARYPGYALNAFRHGVDAVHVTVTPDLRRRLASIARQSKSRLVTPRWPILDLANEADAPAACRRWLGARRNKRTPHG